MTIIDEYKAVLFDVDGVLLDTMPQHVDAWVRAGQELGLLIDEEEVYMREGEKPEKSAKDFIKNAGLMSTRARAQALIDKKIEIFKRNVRNPKVFPGALTSLQILRDAGMKLAFVTGTSRHEINEIMPPDMAECFAASVCGDEILHGKPNPEPYMAAMAQLGVSGKESLVIENAPYGIQSGLAAGATVWALRSYLSDAHLSDAHRIIDLMEDFAALLK